MDLNNADMEIMQQNNFNILAINGGGIKAYYVINILK